MDEIYKQIIACLDNLAESKGLARCGLMYALARLIETYKQKAEEQISELEKSLAEKQTTE